MPAHAENSPDDFATTLAHWAAKLSYTDLQAEVVAAAQRHAGEDREILRARHDLYTQARERNPRRWSGSTRNWSHIAIVTLNRERTEVADAALTRRDTQPLAA